MPTTHQQLIAKLEASGAHRMNFWNTMRRISADWVCDRSFLARTFQPDAYFVDEEARGLTLFEVEVRHHLEKSKLELLIELWFTMDCEGWALELVCIDKHGTWADVRLMDMWYQRHFQTPLDLSTL